MISQLRMTFAVLLAASVTASFPSIADLVAKASRMEAAVAAPNDDTLSTVLVDAEKQGLQTSSDTCTSGTSGHICPMRGSLFVKGDMRHAVLMSLDQDFPGFYHVLSPCYFEKPTPPAYCTAPQFTYDVKDGVDYLKRVMVGRMHAILEFIKEFSSKGLYIINLVTQAANIENFGESRPRQYQLELPREQSRSWQQMSIFVLGKIAVGLCNLLVTGLEEVAEAVAIGPLSLLVPLASYSASLLFTTTSVDSRIGALMERLIMRLRDGLRTGVNHVQQLVQDKKAEIETFDGNLIDLMRLITEAELQATTWLGKAMGDAVCFESAEDCSFLNKAHNKLMAATRIEDPVPEVQKMYNGHAGRHEGGDKKSFSYMVNIILQSASISQDIKNGNGLKFPEGVAKLANLWNGLVSGTAGSVAMRSIFQMRTNIRTDDLNREHMRITTMYQYKDLDAEYMLQKAQLPRPPLPTEPPPEPLASPSPEALALESDRQLGGQHQTGLKHKQAPQRPPSSNLERRRESSVRLSTEWNDIDTDADPTNVDKSQQQTLIARMFTQIEVGAAKPSPGAEANGSGDEHPTDCEADDSDWKDWGEMGCDYYAEKPKECDEYNTHSEKHEDFPATNPCCACK